MDSCVLDWKKLNRLIGEKTKDPYYKQITDVATFRPALQGLLGLLIECV